jgi:hypothetical protein
MVTPYEISVMNINGTNYRSLLKYSHQYLLVSVGDKPMPLTEQESQDLLWIDELHFCIKTFSMELVNYTWGQLTSQAYILPL